VSMRVIGTVPIEYASDALEKRCALERIDSH
jgi:hypothetical protein